MTINKLRRLSPLNESEVDRTQMEDAIIKQAGDSDYCAKNQTWCGKLNDLTKASSTDPAAPVNVADSVRKLGNNDLTELYKAMIETGVGVAEGTPHGNLTSDMPDSVLEGGGGGGQAEMEEKWGKTYKSIGLDDKTGKSILDLLAWDHSKKDGGVMSDPDFAKKVVELVPDKPKAIKAIKWWLKGSTTAEISDVMKQAGINEDTGSMVFEDDKQGIIDAFNRHYKTSNDMEKSIEATSKETGYSHELVRTMLGESKILEANHDKVNISDLSVGDTINTDGGKLTVTSVSSDKYKAKDENGVESEYTQLERGPAVGTSESLDRVLLPNARRFVEGLVKMTKATKINEDTIGKETKEAILADSGASIEDKMIRLNNIGIGTHDIAKLLNLKIEKVWRQFGIW